MANFNSGYQASQFGSDFRDVEIRISGTFQSASNYYSIGNDANGIAATLDSKGWIVGQVTYETQTWFTGPDFYRIFVVVHNQYSDRQVQDQIRRDLAGYFNVAGIEILSQPYSGGLINIGNIDGGTVYGGSANYGNQTPGAGNPNGAGDPAADKAWQDFWKAVGFTAAPSAAVAVIGAVALIMILRK